MAIAIVILILVVLTVVFHFASPWYFTPIASNWTTIDTTIDITFWVTGIVFILVNLFLAYCVYRFRFKKSQKAAYEPENRKLEIWLSVITTIGVVAMLAPGLWVWNDFVHPPDDAYEVEVIGQQWTWTYRFPGEDGKLGKADNQLISVNNPFGLSEDDPYGADDILINSNELHLPVDKPVKILQRSKDVLHNFSIPQFRVKMDLVPGLTSYFWFTPTKTGTYEIFCQELCGVAHYLMRGKIVVEQQQEFEQWLQQQPTFIASIENRTVDLVAGEAQYQICVSCHGVNGEGMQALNGPAISNLSPWYLKRQLVYFKHKIRGDETKDPVGAPMAAIAQTLVDEQQINNLVAYIEQLPDPQQISLTEANSERGETLYKNCGLCHGANGEGNYALSAPRLAGQHDWYLKRQLQNFSDNIRGAHPQDMFGNQMLLMVKSLKTDKDLDDIVAYIGTLSADSKNVGNQSPTLSESSATELFASEQIKEDE
ncbi:cytochrome c oxidase subunit II [Thalassotalea sp. PS06]|uniref:cytochrome c oxidase subunit II n=1 Tax=Thalassotalea sp. PS06 TaxID=2594005 RepID=UPI0011648780|nr:cytochrome c oxidase subunit II [Thalassotalea sp. PS06]QDP01325.1 cytochrome c oxidase subunit II [Thalassotalea sp. PS06]